MNEQLKKTKASQLSLEYGAFKYDSLKEFKFHLIFHPLFWEKRIFLREMHFFARCNRRM